MSDDQTEFTSILTQLFEHSDILINKLIPDLLQSMQNTPLIIDTIYPTDVLIDRAIAIIHAWDADSQAQFIIAHPRIGEVKQLSALSAKEQSGGLSATTRVETPPEVLVRLEHLNACYERVYSGLRYITFVNGRSRAAVAEEMEDKLQLGHPLEAYPDGPPLNEPAVESLRCVAQGSEEWSNELQRAVDDIGRIAKSRQKAVLSSTVA
jgi:2-oxo-4-hydroxy-4-carboxy--5-ureidoimidazoline (OHCU) decarboxylase